MDSLYQIISTLGIAFTLGSVLSIGRKLQTLDDLKDDMGKMKHNLEVIANFLTKNTDFDPKELRLFSPLQLTEEGHQLVSTLGFDKVFAAHKQEFFAFIDEDKPKLKYDVELAAIKSIIFLYDQNYMQFLKIYLYNNPARKLENIAPTLGVYIRDAYLAEHGKIVE